MIWSGGIDSTESSKIYMEVKKFMTEREKNSKPIAEKIVRTGHAISAACLLYDLIPGGNHDMTEKFIDFIRLLRYCDENKMYSVRELAVKKLLEDLTN